MSKKAIKVVLNYHEPGRKVEFVTSAGIATVSGYVADALQKSAQTDGAIMNIEVWPDVDIQKEFSE